MASYHDADALDAGRPAPVVHAFRLMWIVAAFLLAGLFLNVVFMLSPEVEREGLIALAIIVGAGLLAAITAAAIGLRAGRLWAARVLTLVLVGQVVVLLISFLLGTIAAGVISLTANAVAIGKLRRPESRAHLR